MTPATNIDALQPGPPSASGGRAGRHGERAAISPVAPPGRALATQRDALLFRSEAILRLGGPAVAPFLAQQIGQLWPAPPPTMVKAATHAYLRTGAMPEPAEQRASLLA